MIASLGEEMDEQYENFLMESDYKSDDDTVDKDIDIMTLFVDDNTNLD